MSTLESKHIFSGRIIKLNQEKVRLPDDSIADFEIIYHPGGTAIVALNSNNEVCLLKHYRHAVREWVWEIPAGILEGNDDTLLKRAQDELKEETGCTATQWQELGFIISSPGVFTEKVYLFLATDLTMGQQQLELGEVLEVHWLALDKALEKIYKGEINDAKTCIAIVRAKENLDSKNNAR